MAKVLDLTEDEVFARIENGETVVFLDEEYGYRYWVWFPNMTPAELVAWWKAMESVGPHYMNPSVTLPGEMIQGGGPETYAAAGKREEDSIFTAYLHADDDSSLRSAATGKVLHAGYENN